MCIRDSLKDAKIGVQTGTTGDIYCSDDFGDDHVERFNKGADAVQALVKGKIDAVVIDNEPAKAFVDANDGLKTVSYTHLCCGLEHLRKYTLRKAACL